MAEFYLSIGNFQEAIEQRKNALTMTPITNIQTAKFIARLNEVEEYLKSHNGKNLSLRKIYRDLKMKRKKAIWMIKNSKKIKNVDPLDVGSKKNFIHVYKFEE